MSEYKQASDQADILIGHTTASGDEEARVRHGVKPHGPRQAARRLRLFLLGGFRAESAGQPVPPSAWQRGTAKALVKLLALTPGHRLHREQVLDLLWPDADPDSALNSLGKALHAARRALEPDLPPRGASSYLHLADDILALDAARTWIDAEYFERLAVAALSSGDVAAFDAALAAYGGELLPEDRYAHWASARRAALVERHQHLLMSAADLLERRGAYGAAVQRLQQALQVEPAREDVHRRLMRLYARAGSRHQALRQYQLCHAALREDLDADPEPETEALHREILAARGLDGPPGAGPDAGADAVLRLPAAVRRLPPTPLIGRERVLELVLDALAKAAPGNGDMMLIGGEAGAGKTRLVVEVAREAHRRGWLVLWGASYEQEGLSPYGPFVDALESYVISRSQAERRALAEAYPELRPLLPSLAEVGEPAASLATAGTGTAGDGSNRGRLFATIAGLLRHLSTVQPLLLVLDDMHVADAASLQVLHHLARTAPERRWLILVTYRDEDATVGRAFQRLCAALTRANLCRRMDLRRLARPDCDRLVQALLPGGLPEPALLERLFALSLGNPLFLQELVRALQERGMLRLTDGRWRARADEVGVPRQVRELVETRVQAMGEDVRRTLRLAAVAGMECSFRLLRAAGGLSEGPLLDALDRALQARILEEREQGYAFRHPLFRIALYEHLSWRRRVQLHAAVAAALERQQPDEVEALAYHFSRGDDEDKAVLYLERAGDRAQVIYANEAAVGYYREFVDRLERRGDTGAAAGAREKLGGVLTTMARYDEALAVVEGAATIYQATANLERLGATLAQVGRIHAVKGTPDEGIARLQPTLELLAAGGATRSHAALYAALAHLCMASGRYDEQLAAAQRAAVLGRAAGDDRIVAEAEERRGTALIMGGRGDEGLRALEEAIALAEAAGELSSLGRALNGVTVVYYHRGAFGRSAAYAARALTLAERRGDPAEIAFLTTNRGVLAFHMGDWEGARADFERAIALSRQIGASAVAAYPLFALARLRLAQSAPAQAECYLEESLAIAERSGDLQALRHAQAVLAERDLQEGRPAAAHARLTPLLDRPGVADEDTLLLRTLLAWAELELGHIGAAAAALRHVAAHARAATNHLMLVDILRVQALVAIRQARWTQAERLLDEGLSLAHTMSYPYAEARLLHAYGLLHAQKGEPTPARERYAAALAILRRLGARGDMALMEPAVTDL